MSKALKYEEISTLSEDQKNELFEYVYVLTQRDNAGKSIFLISLSVVCLFVVTVILTPMLNAHVAKAEFTPVMFSLALQILSPLTFGVVVGAIYTSKDKQPWNIRLFDKRVKQFQQEFHKKHYLDVSGLSAKEIWDGVLTTQVRS